MTENEKKLSKRITVLEREGEGIKTDLNNSIKTLFLATKTLSGFNKRLNALEGKKPKEDPKKLSIVDSTKLVTPGG